jgi:hypothetical protein
MDSCSLAIPSGAVFSCKDADARLPALRVHFECEERLDMVPSDMVLTDGQRVGSVGNPVPSESVGKDGDRDVPRVCLRGRKFFHLLPL